MKNPFKSFSYKSVIFYALLTFSFLIFNNLENSVLPYSTAILSTALYLGGSPLLCPFLFICSFFLNGTYGLILSSVISAVFLTAVSLVYKKMEIKPKYESLLFTLLSMIGFLILGDGTETFPIEKRVLTVLLTVFLSLITLTAGNAVKEKGLKFKFDYAEFISVAVTVILLGTGICNFISPFIWKGISVFVILSACFLLRFGLGTFVSALLGVSLSVYYGNVSFVAVSLCIGISADVCVKISRYLSVVAILLTDFLLAVVFGVYDYGYSLSEFLPVIIGCSVFAVIPSKPLNELKERLYAFREKQLVRQTVNRNRIMLSNRLYELSGVFTEMANAFNVFKEKGLTVEKAKEVVVKEIKNNVCKECKNANKCKKNDKEVYGGLIKMTDIGFAKGKLSLIDLTKGISDNCVKLNDILYAVNKMIAEFKQISVSVQNLQTGRELISEETSGVSEILKGLAVESGALLKYQSRLERNLGNLLMKNGFYASEILIYGENDDVSISLILTMKEFSLKHLTETVSRVMGFPVSIVDKNSLSEDKFYLSFRKSVPFDAVFGISQCIKDGSTVSGDTHSVARISEDKFLIALSDGMGSGENAERFSSVSLSLIESFYKAGMHSELILNTVNKLLSVNLDESFSALDVAIINLKNCSADFIKYSSPYGYIINDGGVKIVEGNSLPLGILEELHPSVCSTDLLDGDMIVLTSDGVSDAFGSSSEFIDFIRSLPAKNPQTLSDQILNKAIELSNGEKKDDMTVLSVRIYKKNDVA